MSKKVTDIFSADFLKKKREFTIIDISFINNNIFENMSEVFGRVFAENENFKLNVLHFSENNSFFEKRTEVRKEISRKFDELKLIRKRIVDEVEFVAKILGWVDTIYEGKNIRLSEETRAKIENNIFIRKNHCNHTFSAFICDDDVWYAPQILGIADINDYRLLNVDSFEYKEIKQYTDEYLGKGSLSKYLSNPEDEIIEVYEGVILSDGHEANLRRGTLPRSAFLTKDYKRYSVWEFIFNRRGQLLLHQRSKNTKDNRLLWDKSAGGHLNLDDSSSEETAKKELIEELFAANAEHEVYQKVDLDRITSFGEWNPSNRPIESYRSAFNFMGKDDVIMFRATKNGSPYTEDRVSKRRMSELGTNGEIIRFRETIFISDVFYFIAPEGVIDTNEELSNTFEKVYKSGKKGAANAHKLVDLYELKDMIEEAKQEGTVSDEFTDDLVFMIDNRFQLLLEFSAFVKAVFEKSDRSSW